MKKALEMQKYQIHIRRGLAPNLEWRKILLTVVLKKNIYVYIFLRNMYIYVSVYKGRGTAGKYIKRQT